MGLQLTQFYQYRSFLIIQDLLYRFAIYIQILRSRMEEGSVVNPDSMWSLDAYPDPDSQSGSGLAIRIRIQEGENGPEKSHLLKC
jgi:hypothetical protein